MRMEKVIHCMSICGHSCAGHWWVDGGSSQTTGQCKRNKTQSPPSRFHVHRMCRHSLSLNTSDLCLSLQVVSFIC